MTYTLILGNRLYFSWSIAAYMMVKKFDLSNHVDIQIVLPQEEADVARFLEAFKDALENPEGGRGKRSGRCDVMKARR